MLPAASTDPGANPVPCHPQRGRGYHATTTPTTMAGAPTASTT